MTSAEGPRVALGRLFRASPLGGGLSVLANLVTYYGAEGAGLSLKVPVGPGSATLLPLELPAVILASLMPAFLAAIVLAILGRFLAQPFRALKIIAGVVLLLSFLPLLPLPVAPSTKLVLALMHLLSAAAIVWALNRWGRERG